MRRFQHGSTVEYPNATTQEPANLGETLELLGTLELWNPKRGTRFGYSADGELNRGIEPLAGSTLSLSAASRRWPLPPPLPAIEPLKESSRMPNKPKPRRVMSAPRLAKRLVNSDARRKAPPTRSRTLLPKRVKRWRNGPAPQRSPST